MCDVEISQLLICDEELAHTLTIWDEILWLHVHEYSYQGVTACF